MAEKKRPMLSIRIDEELKKQFFELCERNGRTPSKVIINYIKEYVEGSEKK